MGGETIDTIIEDGIMMLFMMDGKNLIRVIIFMNIMVVPLLIYMIKYSKIYKKQ